MIFISNYDFEQNFHHQYGNLYLTNKQLDILNKYNIPYNDFNNMEELLFYLENSLNNDTNEELEILSEDIAEYIYYHDTNK